MITLPLKTYINSRARYLSPADYKDIMQYRDMKSKPLDQLSKKYNVSNSRLYQIWRGQEFNRIQWNDVVVPPSTNVIDQQNEANFQNKYDSTITALENVMRDTEVEPSKSIDSVLEEGGKAKKAGGKKTKSKSALAELIPSSIQSQLIPEPHEKIAERNIKNIANMKNVLEK